MHGVASGVASAEGSAPPITGVESGVASADGADSVAHTDAVADEASSSIKAGGGIPGSSSADVQQVLEVIAQRQQNNEFPAVLPSEVDEAMRKQADDVNESSCCTLVLESAFFWLSPARQQQIALQLTHGV